MLHYEQEIDWKKSNVKNCPIVMTKQKEIVRLLRLRKLLPTEEKKKPATKFRMWLIEMFNRVLL